MKRSSPLPKSHPQFGMSTAHESLVPSGPDRVQVASAPRRLRLARIWPGSRNRQAAPGSGTALAGPLSAGWNSPRTVGLRCAAAQERLAAGHGLQELPVALARVQACVAHHGWSQPLGVPACTRLRWGVWRKFRAADGAMPVSTAQQQVLWISAWWSGSARSCACASCACVGCAA